MGMPRRCTLIRALHAWPPVVSQQFMLPLVQADPAHSVGASHRGGRGLSRTEVDDRLSLLLLRYQSCVAALNRYIAHTGHQFVNPRSQRFPARISERSCRPGDASSFQQIVVDGLSFLFVGVSRSLGVCLMEIARPQILLVPLSQRSAGWVSELADGSRSPAIVLYVEPHSLHSLFVGIQGLPPM